jgi:hypothetical protein
MSPFIARLALAAFLVAPGLAVTPTLAATAQQVEQPAAEPTDAQRKLTQSDIAAFLAASRSVEAILSRLPEDQLADPDAATVVQLEKAAKAAGLKGYADYDEIAANVSFVLQGFDPETKTYVGAKTLVAAEVARAKADKSLSKRERADALRELDEALQSADEVEYPENIDLVAKRYDELAAVVNSGPAAER